MTQAANSTQEDIRAITAQVKHATEEKHAVRDLVRRVCRDIAANASTDSPAARSDGELDAGAVEDAGMRLDASGGAAPQETPADRPDQA